MERLLITVSTMLIALHVGLSATEIVDLFIFFGQEPDYSQGFIVSDDVRRALDEKVQESEVGSEITRGIKEDPGLRDNVTFFVCRINVLPDVFAFVGSMMVFEYNYLKPDPTQEDSLFSWVLLIFKYIGIGMNFAVIGGLGLFAFRSGLVASALSSPASFAVTAAFASVAGLSGGIEKILC